MNERKNDRTAIFEQDRVRPVVYAFLVFELLMLFQTNYLHLGSNAATLLCVIIFITYAAGSYRIEINACNVLLYLYALLLFVCSIFMGGLSSKFWQVMIYVFLFILLSSIELREKESKLLITGFVMASAVYAVLIIGYRLSNISGYVHSSIMLFGTELDPNYIGLPLVISFSILLYQVLSGKVGVWKIVGLVVFAFAVLMTSSRGNFLSLSICMVGNIILFLSSREMSGLKKTMIILLVVLALVSFYSYADNYFESFVQRIFSFVEDGADNGRSELWKQAIGLWADSPIIGNGFEALGRAIGMGVHNTYLQLLCDSGIIGFVLFTSFLVVLVINCSRNNTCLFICMLGLLFHSCFLGAIASRCFWATLIMVGMLLPKRMGAKAPDVFKDQRRMESSSADEFRGLGRKVDF